MLCFIYASSSDVLLQRRPVQQIVEILVIKDAELISWINKQNKMFAFSPWVSLVAVPALAAVNQQCWLKSSVLVSVIIDLTGFFPPKNAVLYILK